MIHETGRPTGREARCAARFPDTDVLVFGHSHIPWDTTAPTGLRLLNPGSPTDRRRQPYATYMTARSQGHLTTWTCTDRADLSDPASGMRPSPDVCAAPSPGGQPRSTCG